MHSRLFTFAFEKKHVDRTWRPVSPSLLVRCSGMEEGVEHLDVVGGRVVFSFVFRCRVAVCERALRWFTHRLARWVPEVPPLRPVLAYVAVVDGVSAGEYASKEEAKAAVAVRLREMGSN